MLDLWQNFRKLFSGKDLLPLKLIYSVLFGLSEFGLISLELYQQTLFFPLQTNTTLSLNKYRNIGRFFFEGLFAYFISSSLHVNNTLKLKQNVISPQFLNLTFCFLKYNLGLLVADFSFAFFPGECLFLVAKVLKGQKPQLSSNQNSHFKPT